MHQWLAARKLDVEDPLRFNLIDELQDLLRLKLVFAGRAGGDITVQTGRIAAPRQLERDEQRAAQMKLVTVED